MRASGKGEVAVVVFQVMYKPSGALHSADILLAFPLHCEVILILAMHASCSSPDSSMKQHYGGSGA